MTFRPILFAVLSTLAFPLTAETISEGERTAAVARLEETRDAFLELLEGIDDEQFHYRAAPDRWSIGEITEHLVKVETVVHETLGSRLTASPPHPEWTSDGKPLLRDHVIRMAVTNRDARRFNAPEIVSPGSDPVPRGQITESFVAARRRTIEYASTTDADLRAHFVENPALGMIDGYQWLLFVAAHTERHTAQAREIIDSPTYPGTLRPITDEERTHLVGELRSSAERLERLVTGISETQRGYREMEGRWSIAEVVEHLARAEDLLFSLIKSTLHDTAPQPDLKGEDGSPRVKDLAFAMAITNRETRQFEAPAPLQPTGGAQSLDDSLAAFRTRRERTIEFASTTDVDLRAWFHHNRGFGLMDTYQWLLLISGHTERHAAQIEEIIASEGYPK